jgi:hypothetical protein
VLFRLKVYQHLTQNPTLANSRAIAQIKECLANIFDVSSTR